MAAYLTGPSLTGAGLPGDVDSVQRNPLGLVVSGIDLSGNYAEYIYLKGATSTIVGSVVSYDESYVGALLAASVNGPVAVALAIVDAATKFGWYGRTGVFATDVVANCADNARLGRETTDGKVGDGMAAGDQIIGAVSRAATSAAAIISCQYNRPHAGVNVA